MDKPCASLVPSMPHEWCASTCARGDCPAAICRCGDNLAAQGLGKGVRPKAAAKAATQGCVSTVSDATDAWCVAMCAMPDIDGKTQCPASQCKCPAVSKLQVKSPRPSPAPAVASSPTPTPGVGSGVGIPSGSRCTSVAEDASDEWCAATC